MRENIYSYDFARNMQPSFVLDDTTYDLVKDDPRAAEGKSVTLTGPATVGFGVSGDKLLGTIKKVEKDKTVTVRTGWYDEGVNLGASPPAVGNIVKADGEGGLVAASTQTNYGPMLIRIDEDGTGVVKLI